MACRELGGTIHTSFHASGKWHTTFSAEAAAKLPLDPSSNSRRRRIEEWPRPSEVKPGIILAYKILTPWSSATSPLSKGMKNAVQIPNATIGKANETMILMVKPSLNLDVQNADIIAELSLADAGRLVVINHEIAMPKINIPKKPAVNFFRGKTKSDLEGGSLRALVFSDDHNGHRMIIDGVVQYKGNEEKH
ncbi:hypothetical protein [Pseudohalocynthiibacter sp. F2068]|uniref:hypothetical protein n=1 Tax=Pseudohalocynthiibacter sp. F2068 TaxID=2926418 RepID=UPI001FF4D2CD|nr:hypothetical protein [Pseudohalocynthiibacter sp. F2068]MCK0103228.1 hypothetical protein [Pseudohalocynthiibacter sp. F2068]